MNVGTSGNRFRRSDADGRPRRSICTRGGQFRPSALSVLTVLVFLAAGLGLESALSENLAPRLLAYLVGGSLIGLALLFPLPWWAAVVAVLGALWAGPAALGAWTPYFSGCASAGFLLAPGFAVIPQWDKIVVLRLGRFHRVRGPGVAFLIPFIEKLAGTVDTRIRVTDFSAEKSITLDTVPVHIDALAFWMIWDAEKAVLEVQDFRDAVVLSAQTALRSTIGSNSLTALLSERERLGEEIQKIVDAKTNPWGITIISVEFKEILVPKELEDALSRQAQAERERSARTILGAAEAEISESYRKAARQYRDDPTALQLRAMNMIYESVRNKGGLVLAPASALDSMNLGTVLGAAAYGQAAGVQNADLSHGRPQPSNPGDGTPGERPGGSADGGPGLRPSGSAVGGPGEQPSNPADSGSGERPGGSAEGGPGERPTDSADGGPGRRSSGSAAGGEIKRSSPAVPPMTTNADHSDPEEGGR